MLELFRKYIENRCSPDEVKLLFAKFGLEENQETLRSLILKILEKNADGLYSYPEKNKNLINETWLILKSKMSIQYKSKRKHVSLFTIKWVRYAAAILFILFGTGMAFYLVKNNNTKVASERKTVPETVIPPGGNKAILTLADGGQIVLDSVANGMITWQEGAQITKSRNGLLEYHADKPKTEKTVYNTVTTPVGGTYQLTLSDGTKVWLNAASSIRFPASLQGNERKVYITGEVFFEVNPQLAQISGGKSNPEAVPFFVEIAGKGTVEVLGTHFNIKAYSDEHAVQTTLLEGSVRFQAVSLEYGSKGETQSVTLVPGQQAELISSGAMLVNSDVDTDEVVAWKNGYFQFSSSSLKDVMNQIARWYDVDVVYEGEITSRRFGGKIQRDLNLTEVLKILEKNKIIFRIKGRQVYVSS